MYEGCTDLATILDICYAILRPNLEAFKYRHSLPLEYKRVQIRVTLSVCLSPAGIIASSFTLYSWEKKNYYIWHFRGSTDVSITYATLNALHSAKFLSYIYSTLSPYESFAMHFNQSLKNTTKLNKGGQWRSTWRWATNAEIILMKTTWERGEKTETLFSMLADKVGARDRGGISPVSQIHVCMCTYLSF